MTFSFASLLHVYEVRTFSVIVKTDCETYGSSAALVIMLQVGMFGGHYHCILSVIVKLSQLIINRLHLYLTKCLALILILEHYSDHLECGQVLGGVSAGSAPGPGEL